MEILIDTRENTPLDLADPAARPPITTSRATLQTGDYSIAGLTDRVAIERKTLADAYGTIGRGRARFVRELERLSAIHRHPAGGYACIVIEADLSTFFEVPPARSAVDPRAAIGSLVSWSVRYGIPIWFAGDRRYATALTRKILAKFHVKHLLATTSISKIVPERSNGGTTHHVDHRRPPRRDIETERGGESPMESLPARGPLPR